MVLTRDHTVVSGQMRLGLLSAREAAEGSTRHLLNRSIGNNLFVAVDISNHQIFRGDVMLLCSDGLHGCIETREINPEISPRLQEIIYRAIERDPKNRYASAREFAHDLEHPDEVGVEDRPELRDWKQRRSPLGRRILFYVMLAMIPVVVFGLLLYVARR